MIEGNTHEKIIPFFLAISMIFRLSVCGGKQEAPAAGPAMASPRKYGFPSFTTVLSK